MTQGNEPVAAGEEKVAFFIGGEVIPVSAVVLPLETER